MTTLTIAWAALPFVIGFTIYLLPRLDRGLAIAMTSLSLGYGLQLILSRSPLTLALLDSFGVTLIADSLSGFFIVTNALVTAAVIIYCWSRRKTAFFYTQAIILHGSVNAAFIAADLISLYVALEVIGIAAFLLIAYPRSDRAVWVALRYLFISNTAMLFYLVGAILVYKANHSFSFSGLSHAPPEAIALIFIGLLTKGGIFVSGLWLPLTHSEAETPVSAMLSGVVVKAGVFPLLRCALMVDSVAPLIQFFGIATAVLGVSFALFEKDVKRLLALSTVSQMGFILVAPVAGGFYALTHGLVKSALFLISGNLPSRRFDELRHQPISAPLWICGAIASLSISGLPPLAGFGAKVLTVKVLAPWAEIVLTVAAVGTAIAFSKILFLPHQSLKEGMTDVRQHWGLYGAIVLLLGSLLMANGVDLKVYTLANVGKSIAIAATGWLIYRLVVHRAEIRLPRVAEAFDHLIGAMILILILLFWMVWA